MPDVNGKHGLRRGIAYDPYDDSKVNDVLQVVDVNDVSQKPRKKGPASQGDNAQVCGNPEAKGVIIVQIGRVKGKALGR